MLVKASNTTYTFTVQTRRPRWNTGAGFFQGIAQGSFSTNATSALGCPSPVLHRGDTGFRGLPFRLYPFQRLA
jgi:hypothetical protein